MHGQNILHLATMCDSSVTLHWIIRNKLISVDSTDKNGDSILHIAAKHDKPVLVDWILDNKFPIDLTNKNGDAAYDTARKHQKHTIAELLATYGYLFIKDCRQHTVLSPLKEIVRKGNIVVCKGRSGWFLMDSTTTRISCKADDIIRIPSVLLPLLIPVKPTMRLELLIKKLSLLDQISALQVGDEVYVKLDHCSIPLKAVIKFRGILPSMKGEYFGVQLLEETHHGECDGKYQSAQLFSCPPNSGLFISADKLIVLNFDSKLIAEYHKQCASGKAASRFYKVTFVGAEGAGKTSTVRTMLGKPFDPNEPSTIGTSLTFRALVNYFLSWLEPNSEEKVPEIIKLDKSVAIDWKEATATELKTLLDKEYTRELYEKLQSLIQPVIDQPNNLLTDDVRDLPDTAPTSSISSNGGSNNQYSTIASADCKENGSSSPSQVTPDFPNEDDGVKGTVKVVYGNKAEKLSAKAAISDFAGQLRFFSFQLLFLKKHDVIVLTINASVKLDDPIVPREELQYTRERKTAAGMMTTLEAVHFWLQSISARFGMSVVPIGCMSRRSPTVIICCTHAEKLSVAKQQSVVDIIRESLFDKPYAEHLPDKNEEAFHLISNKNRKKFKYAIARLQLVVLKAATPALEEKRPISYLKLEELIGDEVEEGANLIDTTVFTHLANQSGIVGDKDSDAITAALEYCSQRGVLLHFPDVPDISSLVFISPQWLSDLFATVVNVHDSVPKGFSLQHAWKRYSTHAILEEDFFDYVLEKGSYLDHKTTVIAIMKKFDLLTEVPSKTSFLGETQHSESRKRLFIVPSLLICDPKSSSYELNEKDQVLLYSFPDQYLPESVLNQLLVRFISWSVEKEFGIHNIQYGFGQFALGKFQVYRLVYNQKFSQLKLIVSQLESCWQEKKLQHSILESFQELLLQLENSLQELMDFYLPSATKPVVFVSCPYCPLNDPPHVPYSKDEMYLYCCKRNPVVEIPKARYIPCGIDSKGLCSQVVTCDVTDHEQMHFNSDAEELSISDMKLINDIIVPKVSAYWHVVLVYLEYDVAFKKELEKKHKGDP
ncbi:uncharacterized protein [Dysidea avara]|uniref:uncharacterized protein isoform X2 n=1 Tax=Dysidea avara TaxID=196820 RepID=UPI0033245379